MIRKHGTSAHRNAFDAICQKTAEKNALQAKKEAEILDPLRAERREMLDKIDATRALVALAENQLENEIAEKQLENKIAQKRKVPPRKGEISSRECVSQSLARSRKGHKASRSQSRRACIGRACRSSASRQKSRNRSCRARIDQLCRSLARSQASRDARGR